MRQRLLNGWKEISGYVERSVRTAQRWEAQAGMPVHRPAPKESGAVVALTDELDRWICRAPSPAINQREEETLLRMLEEIGNLVTDTAELASGMRLLQKQLRQSLQQYQRRFASRPADRQAILRGQGPASLLNFPAAAHELPERSQQR